MADRPELHVINMHREERESIEASIRMDFSVLNREYGRKRQRAGALQNLLWGLSSEQRCLVHFSSFSLEAVFFVFWSAFPLRDGLIYRRLNLLSARALVAVPSDMQSR